MKKSNLGLAAQPELYDEAKNKGWSVISMKNDWKRIFASSSEEPTRGHCSNVPLGWTADVGPAAVNRARSRHNTH
jgi:hypothetical protein